VAPDDKPDFHFLSDASATLLGYFVHTWYRQYLNVIVGNIGRWYERGLIQDLFEPAERVADAFLFDFEALDLEKTVYINGIYFYILACHKGANYRLMNRFEGKQVLYLRGFDYEGSVATGGGLAIGFSSMDSEGFNVTLGELLAPHFALFKIMSPKDVYWETVSAQRYFYRDFSEMTRLAQRSFRSIYVNALSWKDGVAHLFDRMDHFVVYVSSMTESALWELEQLDIDGRRGRVTVVFDEKAIANKVLQLDVQEKMREQFGDKLIWSKQGTPPYGTAAELREHLTERFVLTTLDAFKANIEEHQQRIAKDSAPLAPGARETWIDFRFQPALPAEKLKEISDFSDSVQEYLAACMREKGIHCLPLFLNNLQLRIFLTLLMGQHHETGLALAAYGAVMQGALDYYQQPGKLSEAKREAEIKLLENHLEMAEHIGGHLLSFGRSHEFANIAEKASAEFKGAFDETKAAVAQVFERVSSTLY
jgi:hypothetical protein